MSNSAGRDYSYTLVSILSYSGAIYDHVETGCHILQWLTMLRQGDKAACAYVMTIVKAKGHTRTWVHTWLLQVKVGYVTRCYWTVFLHA